MVRYNFELLKTIVKRDGCIIDIDQVIDSLNRNIRVNFICKCGKSGAKSFKRMYKMSGGFCWSCTSVNKLPESDDEEFFWLSPPNNNKIEDEEEDFFWLSPPMTSQST
jgi:hypothetical protein